MLRCRDLAEYALGKLSWATGFYGKRLVAWVGLTADACCELITLAGKSVWLASQDCAPDAVPLLGNERRMPQYPGETLIQYKARLLGAPAAYDAGGTGDAIEEQLVGFGITSARVRTPDYTHEATAGDLGVHGTPAVTESLADYRVEITGAGDVGGATFRWSRNGGSTWEATGLVTSDHYSLGSTGLWIDFPGTWMTAVHYWTFSAFAALLPQGHPTQFWVVVPSGSHPFGPPPKSGAVGVASGSVLSGITNITDQQIVALRRLATKWKASRFVCREFWFEIAGEETAKLAVQPATGV